MNKSIFLWLHILVLMGCSSAHKFEDVEVGMDLAQVTESLGKPEKISVATELHDQQYYYMLRDAPYKTALGVCAVLPIVIPTFAVMWFSDGCLGESGDYRIEFKDNVVSKKEKLEKQHPY